jgi:plasmid stabilization system protein ParE
MSLPVVFLAAAADEFRVAYRWYERQRPGLGDELFVEVSNAIRQIAEAPTLHAILYRDLRRVLTRRFPYAVYYRVEANRIVIVAVFHGSRNPKHWRRRS